MLSTRSAASPEDASFDLSSGRECAFLVCFMAGTVDGLQRDGRRDRIVSGFVSVQGAFELVPCASETPSGLYAGFLFRG